MHSQSSVRCRTSTTLCGFGISGADFLPVQNGPETVDLDGGNACSAVCLRFGAIVTFCYSLSRLAAVQGSSLIVSLPRFVRRVERNTRPEGNVGLFLATKRWRTGPSQSRRPRCWLALFLTGGRPPCLAACLMAPVRWLIRSQFPVLEVVWQCPSGSGPITSLYRTHPGIINTSLH